MNKTGNLATGHCLGGMPEPDETGISRLSVKLGYKCRFVWVIEHLSHIVEDSTFTEVIPKV